MTYYDTVNEGCDNLKEYKAINDSLEAEILRFFSLHRHFGHSPSYLWKTIAPHVPLTSIRRAVCDLTTKGLLERTDDKVIGAYGRNERVWKYRKEITPENAVQMQLEL